MAYQPGQQISLEKAMHVAECLGAPRRDLTGYRKRARYPVLGTVDGGRAYLIPDDRNVIRAISVKDFELSRPYERKRRRRGTKPGGPTAYAKAHHVRFVRFRPDA